MFKKVDFTKKKSILVLFLMLTTAFMFADVKNIAVAKFDITGNAVSSDEADAITELFISELVSTGKVNVVDRSNFEKIMQEMKFQSSDWSNQEKTVELGNAVNASLVARGQVIKLGTKMYLSSTIIDVKTAKVLSSARKEFNTIDDIFGLLTEFAKDTVAGLTLKIGDIGPGGGLIFYIEGNKYLECSELLGQAYWEDASTLCKDYRGGGYSDWYLPTMEELNYIYQNLRRTGKISGQEGYWSSSSFDEDEEAYVQWFASGSSDWRAYTYYTFLVRAVRAFTY